MLLYYRTSEFLDLLISALLILRNFQKLHNIIIFRITIGKTITSKKPSSTCNPLVNHPEQSLKCGIMVVLRLNKYKDEIPQIARIVRITDFEITIDWWVGTKKEEKL